MKTLQNKHLLDEVEGNNKSRYSHFDEAYFYLNPMQNNKPRSQLSDRNLVRPLPLVAHVIFGLLLILLFTHRSIPRSCETLANSLLLDRVSAAANH